MIWGKKKKESLNDRLAPAKQDASSSVVEKAFAPIANILTGPLAKPIMKEFHKKLREEGGYDIRICSTNNSIQFWVEPVNGTDPTLVNEIVV